MSTRTVPTPTPPASPASEPPYDVSQLFLWPLPDVGELFPIASVHDPRARRLAVLLAEAQAAGARREVLLAVLSWARLYHDLTPHPTGRSALLGILDEIELHVRQREDMHHLLRMMCVDISNAPAPYASTAEEIASMVATLALHDSAGAPASPLDLWTIATTLLAHVVTAAPEMAEQSIVRCGALAYIMLFSERWS